MFMHAFLFQPGEWLGEGKVTFSASPDVLRFYTRWNVADVSGGLILCQQLVEMQDQLESIHNAFCLTDIKEESFSIELSNDIIGSVGGKGIIDTKTIGWEFRHKDIFEGYEVYELESNGNYLLHAEYASPEQFRTIIDGKIWLKR